MVSFGRVRKGRASFLTVRVVGLRGVWSMIRFEERNEKDLVNIGIRWESWFISHFTNAFCNRVWAIEFLGKFVARETSEGCLAVSLSKKQYPIAVGEDVMTSPDVRCFSRALLRQHQIGLQLVQNMCLLLKGGVQIGFRCSARYIIRDGWWWCSIERLERGCFDGRMVRRIVPKLGEEQVFVPTSQIVTGETTEVYF